MPLPLRGEVSFTSGPPARAAKQFHHMAPTRSTRIGALSFQGSGAARFAAISVIPGWWEAPHSIAMSGPSSARSNGSISGRARSASVKKASGKAGAAEEHAHLRKRERRPVQGDPRGVADDCEPRVSVTPRSMRWQTAQAGASRQKVAPKCAVLRKVLAGDPRVRVRLYFMSGNPAS